MTDQAPAAGESSKQDRAFYVVIMVLVAVIVVTLGALWMVERRGRMRTMGELHAVETREKQLEGALRQLVLDHMAGTVDREELATQTVQWDGKPREVRLLSAKKGAALGFKPGDAILVSQSQPASQATEPEGAMTKSETRMSH